MSTVVIAVIVAAVPLVVPLDGAGAVVIVVVTIVVVPLVTVVVAGSLVMSLDGVTGVTVGPKTLLDRRAASLLSAAPMPRGRWVLTMHRLHRSRIPCQPLA
jgi:hypothetical protein